MQTATRTAFTTITTEGAILPADLLQRIADGRDLAGLRPEDYHLAPNERLNEAISRSWNRLLGVWANFDEQRQGLSEADSGTSLTRERWLLILFDELGYGRLPFRGGLSTDGEDEDSPRYPISHTYEDAPIHLTSFRQSLDRTDGERAERYRRSPHSLLQEFLNRSDHALWGIVSNGLRLRILRDNASFTRAAYLEFDLEAMMTGELYADFVLLWLVAHQSRLEPRPVERRAAAGDDDEDGADNVPARLSVTQCWLEIWSQDAAERGTRALDSLRDGVQDAIARLGSGFLAHPANGELRRRLQRGDLSRDDYYRQLLRLVYRLIFLFVAEDRQLLLLPGAPAEVRERYMAYYSLTRLRELAARRRSGPHPDLYRGLRQVLGKLQDGYPELGLPALGSFLFSERATPELDSADIANEALLDAIRALAFTVEGRVLRPVDYRNLGAEELGSVYESLLELHPQLNVDAATFALDAVAGSERKTTGSYYTPTSLITSLLDSALEPVVADRLRGLKGAEAEAALLDIKVVDPAAGSGHFLIAAANRLATHLARVRTGDEEPSPADRRDALRDVVGRCIYGVDINEMAVELCKVALWMETVDPGRPLSFLDHHIQCGNSLLGTTPALLAGGIPDEAFTPITGDDKKYVSDWKKRNKQEREGQTSMAFAPPWERLGNLAEAIAGLEATPDETLEGVRAREERYAELVRSSDYANTRLLADAWCAAFVFPKHHGVDYPISEDDFRDIERNPHGVARWLRDEVVRLRDQYQFFHWHLAFPEVFRPVAQSSEVLETSEDSDPTGWTGGFDVVLGNPPWERIKLQEKEWFAPRDEAIATAPNAAARRRLIDKLRADNPPLYAEFMEARRQAEGESVLVRNSGHYPLCGRGDVNTYTIFAELARHLLDERGRAGIIVPSGIATDDTTKFYFQDISETASLVSLYDFENREKLFPAVDSRMKFCLLTLTGPGKPAAGGADFVFFALNTADLQDDERHFTLTADEIALLNPNTRTCPIFRSKRDAELTKAIYRRVPVLIREEDKATGEPEVNPWGISFLRMFDMSNDSGLFRTRKQLEETGYRLIGNRFVGETETYLPLYEAKMLHHFDHRWATYENDGDTRDVTAAERDDPSFVVLPRYWVSESEVAGKLEEAKQWLLAFRDITNTTNERTAIFGAIPISAVGNNAPLANVTGELSEVATLLAASMSTFAFDFSARLGVGGTHMNFFIAKQLPVLPPHAYNGSCLWAESSYYRWLLPRVLELTYTANDLRPFALDCGYHGAPFRWDEERRFLLRCELDAAYFHLYGIDREDVAYIMDTFPIVRRKDKAEYGEYRAKRVILEMYDEMATAMAGGAPYQTWLSPPPGDPAAAHPWDEAHLGPELPVEEWWQDVESADLGVEVVEETGGSLAEPSPAYHADGEAAAADGPPLELRRPPVKPSPAEKPARSATAASQRTLPVVAPPLDGPRAVRLRQTMELGRDMSAAATWQLIACLADPDSNIRWLAGGSLIQRGGREVVDGLAVFLRDDEPDRVTAARGEVHRVLAFLADTAEGEDVREAANELLDSGLKGDKYTKDEEDRRLS